MKVIYIFVVAIILFPRTLLAVLPSEIKNLSTLPENKIDIGYAALILAKEIFPQINIAAYSAKIDEIVVGVEKITKGSDNPDFRIRALNTYLYKIYGLQYNKSDPYVKEDKNRFINGVLDTKKGSCASMPLLYLSVAQRLGYPVYPVTAPQHVFLRYEDPKLEMKNIEATNGGGYSPDDEYQATLQVSSDALDHGIYLRTLTYREFLGILIEQNGIYWSMHGNNERGIEYLETAIKLNPRAADSIRSLGIAYKIESKKVKEPLSSAYASKAINCFEKAKKLGATDLPLEGYVEIQRKAQEDYRKNHNLRR